MCGWRQGITALFCGNVFIVGINQIYDVRIDKINKPFLPIASGELDIAGAWIIVLVSSSSSLHLLKIVSCSPKIVNATKGLHGDGSCADLFSL